MKLNNITNAGKKALLIGGLATILSGCNAYVEEDKQKIEFKDLNKDGKVEQIYFNYNKSELGNNVVGGFDKNARYYTKEMYVREGLGEGQFSEPKIAAKFASPPLEIRFEDITGDGILDLIYLERTSELGDETETNLGKTRYYVTNLMMRKGNGDGSFQEAKLVQRYTTPPDDID